MTSIRLIYSHIKNSLGYSLITLTAICLTSCNQSKDNRHIVLENKMSKSENLPTFLIYGELIPVGYTKEGDSISTKKFGFNIKRVADCEVTSGLIDSVRKINTKSNIIMKSKYGNDWKQKFEKQSKLKIAIPEI